METSCLGIALALTLLVSAPGRGEQPNDPAIVPIVSDDSLVIVRIDTAKVNPTAMLDWAVGQLSAQHSEKPRIDVIRNAWQPSRAGVKTADRFARREVAAPVLDRVGFGFY